jgi:uncharacterized membrane protein
MPELVVIAFDSADEGDRLLTRLDELQRDWLIDLDDAVIAVRRPRAEFASSSRSPHAAKRGRASFRARCSER